MAEVLVGIDLSQPVGSRFAPETEAEIQAVAPSAVTNGSISTAKLADGAVVEAKLGDGSVTGAKLGAGAVGTTKLGAGAVTEAKLADGAVGPTKVGTGVMTATDHTNNPIELTGIPLTALQYAALTPDPNTLYFLTT